MDALVVEVAARQHGVVTAAQLRDAGLSRDAIAHRVERGWLTRLHRGVYRAGPLTHPLTDVAAAVLACGPRAVASHRTAAALHGFAERPGWIDVTVPQGHPRRRGGVRVHRSDVEEIRVHNIPATTPQRTISDLAAEMSGHELRRAIEEALIQRKLNHTSLTDAVRNARGRRGASALRAAAEAVGGTTVGVTRSEAERRLRDLIASARLKPPRTNVRVGLYEVDALWATERLAVEVDGYSFHGHRAAFERDRRRDADLAARGLRVIRVTWRQLADEPEAVIARLATALAAGR